MGPKISVAALLSVSLLAAPEAGIAQRVGLPVPPPPANASEAAHIEAARRLGGSDLATSAHLLCLPGMQVIRYMQDELKAHPPEEPYKVFDNLYMIGNRHVVSWVLKTSEGLILIDSMSAPKVKAELVDAMSKVGLNPRDIKYVFVSHGHSDHYGGAKYLQETYGARIVASAAEWDLLANTAGQPGAAANPSPRKDITVKDGEKFTLGDTTIQVFETPGHTPGTISFIFPVKHKGQTYYAADWGGTSQPAAGAANDAYERSLAKFAIATRAAHVSVGVSNHPLVDGSIERLERLKANPNGPHPFLIGEEAYRRYADIHRECLLAARARPAQSRGGGEG